MARLTRLYDQLVIISRLQAVSGSNRSAMSTVTAVYGHLQPADAEMSQRADGVYGKTYRIWVDGNVDLLNGDELKDEHGARYTVRKGGVIRQTHGVFDFKEVILDRVTE